MKVRLKLELLNRVFFAFDVFQFHEGPIKTLDALVQQGELTSFNSMKVRLKRSRYSV